ncbi:unnamed protein product [marine sediment metagenome]|uniref:Uncharacterized protein n=1 Tax=marine sediment metagenome TaxID=412755 RepID=X1S4R7_9ZZZZ
MTTVINRAEYMKEYRKKYYLRNKEKMTEYYKKNKEKLCQTAKEYRKENYERILATKKEYYNKNHDEIILKQRAYLQTEKGKKINRIASWKSKGVISDDFDSLYEKYMNTNNCENCDIELVSGAGLSNKKHLDHDHRTNLFRNVLCGSCNINRRE